MTQAGKIAVVAAPNQPLEMWQRDIPEVKPNDVLLKTIISGICGTDVHEWRGRDKGLAFPTILGHEIIGRIYDLGGKVTKDFFGKPVKQDDLVSVIYGIPCGACYFCLRGDYTKCADLKHLGSLRNTTNIHRAPFCFMGGFCDYVYIPEGFAGFIKLPEKLSSDLTAPFQCAGPTMLHGFEYVPIGLDESVVIQGSGPLGLFSVVYAKERWAGKIIMVGAPKGRLRMAERLGADHLIDINITTDSNERIEQVKDLTEGRGADVVIECTGVPSAVNEGIAMSRAGGRYLVIGNWTDRGQVAIKPYSITFRQLHLHGSASYTPKHIYAYLRLLEKIKDKYPIRELVTHKFELDQATEALEAMEKGESTKAVFYFSKTK